MLRKPRVRTLALAGCAVWACALPENAVPPDGGAGGSGNNTAAGGPISGTGGTSQGGATTGGATTGGATTGGATTGGSGGSMTGGSTTGGSSGAGGSTGGSMAGASTGGAMGGAGTGTGGSAAGMGGTMAGAGMGGKGGSMAGAGQGGTMAGAGMGGKGGTGGTTSSVLVHRYSFSGTDTTAMDSVGTAHGTINGGTQGSGVVTLTGGTSDQYVQLPASVLDNLSTATFEAWATWTGGNNNWQRIWDFGTSDAGDGAQGATNTGSPYFFFTPRATTTSNPNCTNATASMPRVAITGMGPMNEDCAFGTAAFPMSALTHVAVVIDATPTMTLYIGGNAVGGPVTLNYGIANVAGHTNNWLGRSQFSNDTEYAGTISEFRIYNSARSTAQISASATAGPDSVPTQ